MRKFIDMSKIIETRYYRDDTFCAECGTILPLPDMKKGFTTCPRCKMQYPAKEMVNQLVWTYKHEYEVDKVETKATSGEAEGPDVERICSKCGHDRMSYSTRQTRSADEGMTVFFTCLKCGHKDIEYS